MVSPTKLQKAATEHSSSQTVFSLIKKSKYKKIGWGTGACFRNPYWPTIHLDYLVDNDRSKWGSRVNGLAVRNPEVLRNEDPATTIIVIYSQFFRKIVPQLLQIGPFHFATIFAYDGHIHAVRKLNDVRFKTRAVSRRFTRHKDSAMVMQGPIFPSLTKTLIRCLKALNPGVPLILSTWTDTPSHLLRSVRSHVDYLLLNPAPAFGGGQNRNRQIVSTTRGLEAAAQLGVRKALKLRTDAAPLSQDLFDACEFANSLYDKTAARKQGLHGRLIVPETFTRKYLLYHPSDILMWGHIEDMLQFWHAPQDNRKFNFRSPDWKRKSLYQVARDKHTTECHLAVSFAQSIGWKLKFSLADSWILLRDLFLIQNNDWLDLFWAKSPKLPPLYDTNPLLECLSHYGWQQLISGNISKLEKQSNFDIRTERWGRFFNPRYKSSQGN